MTFSELQAQAKWLRRETLKLHKKMPETRIASCLSDIEIFVALYYGGLLEYYPEDPLNENRDRFIVSKGHGGVSLYPVLADLGFFSKHQLEEFGTEKSFLGVIPDTITPGFETINGSLGHGLGVACGIALALRKKKSDRKVFVLCGDGELNCGSVWEAVMFAAYHKLAGLILIVDDNKISMLGPQKEILNLAPLTEKFSAFGWQAESVDGHNVKLLCEALRKFRQSEAANPKVLIAETVKGKGVERLENNPLCHVLSLKGQEVDQLLGTI